MQISSADFEMNGCIPTQFTCDGTNVHPTLHISDIPRDAISLALIMEDPDVPKTIRPDGVWDHWIVWNIPPTCTTINEHDQVPGIQGCNTSGSNDYQGPCPPDREHRYIFTLFALDTSLDLRSGASKSEVQKAMSGHIIDTAELIGRYNRHPLHQT